jgi:mannitol/fructose-specific phosphotransferase system IIA component (Ntr-type)
LKLSDFLVREAIVTDLRAATAEESFREIVDRMQDAGELIGVDRESMVRAMIEREELSSQSIGSGVACPEGVNSQVDRVIGTIALSRRGVGFGAADGKPVDIIVSLFHNRYHAPPEEARRLLDAWETLARSINDGRFVHRLRQCMTPDEVWELILEVDQAAG